MTYRDRYWRILTLWGHCYMPRTVREHLYRRAVQRPLAALLALV